MATITTWRICAPGYADTAYSGEGARVHGGRWNSKGRAVVYSSESISLTVLEQLVHVEDPTVLDAFVVVSATLDEDSIEVLSPSSLPDDWRTYPAPPSLKGIGDAPVAVRDNIRIRRCRIYPSEEQGHDDTPKRKSFRGYIASKRRYFHGLRVHLVVTGAGEPVEFALAAGSESDITIFKEMELDLPEEGAIILADKAYTDYDEDLLEEAGGLHLKAQRKKRSK